MGFIEDNTEYKSWLRTQCCVAEEELDYKHDRMTVDGLTFLRATCFRWSRRIEAICPELKTTPSVLSVGDAHLENFGTWRDDEGRLVWGVNDFDEAADLPYAYDLVRLATSARLARDADDNKNLKPFLLLNNNEIAQALLMGYSKGLETPSATLVDEEKTVWLRPYVICTEDKRKKFWKEFDGYENDPRVPNDVKAGFKKDLPNEATIIKTAARPHRGGGSLGRPRFIALAEWRGGRVVREAKALVPAAWDWAHDRVGPHCFEKLARSEYRSFDPWLKVIGNVIFRRLAADARKVNLTHHTDIDLSKGPSTDPADVRKLLEAMGFDIGAIHAATRGQVEAIKADLNQREDSWLYDAAKKAAKWVSGDYNEWRRIRDVR